MKIETIKLIPETRTFEIKQTDEIIKIRYLRTGRGGRNSNWITLPRIILLTPKLITAFGIYYAEGNKSKTRWYSSFSNTEPNVLFGGIELFHAFGISTKELKAHIKTYSTISDAELIHYWSQIVGLSESNFIKCSRGTAKQNYLRNRKKPPLYGVLEIYYNSVVIRDLIDQLLDTIKLSCFQDTNIRNAFLKGLFSGEGTVKIVANKLREIRIASCNKTEQKFIRAILLKENIIPSKAEYNFYVSISGFKNFKMIHDSGIVNLHPEKKYLFDTGYENCFLSSGK